MHAIILKRFAHVAALLVLPLLIHGLTPRESESREILSLDGLWDFMSEKNPGEGANGQWYLKRIAFMEGSILMPVPSSYNDVTQSSDLRDHIGVVWYQRCVFLPRRFRDHSRRVVLHFGSVNYDATVWLNGEQVARHEGGHLPFETTVSKSLARNVSEQEACITVAVNNTLTPQTIPQGTLVRPEDPDMYPPGFVTQKLNFDFFNYAGLHRSVVLYTTPHCFLHDLTLVTSLETSGTKTTGYVIYDFNVRGRFSDLYFNLLVRDAEDQEVLRESFQRDVRGRFGIEEPHLWWPHLSRGPGPAYLYTLEIQVIPNDDVDAMDIYRTKFGIRTIEWTNTSLLINKEPFRFHGFGRHEDSDVRGRGLDVVLTWHDGYLLSWLGVNSYRTSHYPYSEESLDVADHFGFVVIAEMPAVGLT
ncbi:hypothetical protein B566_EDAN002685 [Ephemera danica]|nr:hypothetical protein B566_EDAN002685 [Ephemera danica]